MPTANSTLSRNPRPPDTRAVRRIIAASGTIQLVAAHGGLVLLDLQDLHVGVDGRTRQNHAAMPLSMAAARELLHELGVVIAEAEARSPEPTARWGRNHYGAAAGSPCPSSEPSECASLHRRSS